MSYIQTLKGTVYAPGFFLAKEECKRETRTIPATMGVDGPYSTKYVPMGTIYPSNTSSATGIVYEDVDVTTGDVAGSVVTSGEVYENRLPVIEISYDSASVTSADNPTTKGWYEKDGDSYDASADTVAVVGKTYYTRGGTSPDYTYTAVDVDDIEYGDNPKELGLYERSGSSPNYTYTLSTDTQADGSKTYYEATEVHIGSDAKTALIALGFKFVTSEPSVTRPY